MIEKIIRWWHRFLDYTFTFADVEIKGMLTDDHPEDEPPASS